MIKSPKSKEDTYSPEQIDRRMDAALKRALNTPHKPHKKLKKKAVKKRKQSR